MPSNTFTWKANQQFNPGTDVLLGTAVLPAATGYAQIRIDRSGIPAGSKLVVKVQTRNVGEAEWQSDFSMTMDNTNGLTPNKDGVSYLTIGQTSFNRSGNWEVRALGDVIGPAPFSFDASIFVSW